jgi:hypothetical protein
MAHNGPPISILSSGTLKKKKKSDNINNDFSDCPTQIKSSDDNQIKHGNTYNNMEEHDGKGKDNSDSVNRLKCEKNIDKKRWISTFSGAVVTLQFSPMIFFLSQSNELLIQTFISPEQFSLRLQLIVSVLSFCS